MDRKALAQKLEGMIRPRTAPLGICLLKNGESPPKEAVRPQRYGIRISLCQWATLARTWNRPAGVLGEDINCTPCLATLGFQTLRSPQDLAQYFMDMGYFEDSQKALEAVDRLAPLPSGAMSGMVLFPLDQVLDRTPDLIWIYGTPAQMSRLAGGWVYKTGEFVESLTTGFGFSCLSMVKPLFTKKPAFVHPGRGERILAGTEEDEMAFCFPASGLADLVEGLEKTHEKGSRYPVQRFVIHEPPVLKPLAALGERLGPPDSAPKG